MPLRNDCELDDFGPDGFLAECIPPGMELPINPYDLRDHKHPPLPPRSRAPGLPRIDLEPSSVDFIERLPNGLYEGAPSGLFRVNVMNMGERLLKIFHSSENEDKKRRGFFREAVAYENLLQGGICAAGVVPYCYGYTVIDQSQLDISGKYDWLLPFRADPKPLKVLVLEFLPCASKMTLRWMTPQTARAAMDAMDMIHQAGVIHGDVHPRNLLVTPDGRVVWIDFELAGTWPRHHYVTRQGFHYELGYCWCWLYQRLLPYKWLALRELYSQGLQEDRAQIEAIEQVLVSHGAKISV